MIKPLKDILRYIRDILFTVIFFVYDFYRFSRYSGMSRKDMTHRDFRLIKIYHALEKSLSYRKQKKKKDEITKSLLKACLNSSIKNDSFSEKVAEDVLIEFNAKKKESFINNSDSLGGAMPYSELLMRKGILDRPEDFFLSRYTIREFNGIKIKNKNVMRAIELANKTPSSCNRQPWFIYHIDDSELINKVLNIQGGAKGFGESIPSLVIISVDQRAYDTSVERYQGWIDGGMYGMSFIYACHSLGLGTCSLNWAKNMSTDKKIRSLLPIKNEHNILMMIGIGMPFSEFKVCRSTRGSILEKYIYIEKNGRIKKI